MTKSSVATVETITAEVRALMIGSRQVTMSVCKQLDWVTPADIEPFGRVRISGFDDEKIWIVGRDRRSESLVISSMKSVHDFNIFVRRLEEDLRRNDLGPAQIENRHSRISALLKDIDHAKRWEALPLIVLAGLR